ncbi:MarR family winged helix-turn-helix transcriptional regulator [Streptomyces sp. NBC_00094]|uniref:MarR family winged helix-turn-helix transcriptional regulator n=1 Tax=Streptomyces sp. NBC_00094 TaxID=2903620 RepID=UPI00224DEFB5|nr:MarR family transcriptional regulator [Streptomyces sp. NBC_00094]MCX5391634.1 MarR family transcriptional regulator [Streptomyces sp. NBC_00094]
MSEQPSETPDMDERQTPERLRALPSRLLALTAAQADRLVSACLAAEDARKWHYAVLVSLDEHGPTSQAGLSRRTGIYRSDLVSVINELADQGHVERTPDPADRRRNVVTMTDRGRAHLRRLDEVLADAQDELMEPLSVAERALLASLLERLIQR